MRDGSDNIAQVVEEVQETDETKAPTAAELEAKLEPVQQNLDELKLGFTFKPDEWEFFNNFFFLNKIIKNWLKNNWTAINREKAVEESSETNNDAEEKEEETDDDEVDVSESSEPKPG